jgi:2-haloacid dehalogenase
MSATTTDSSPPAPPQATPTVSAATGSPSRLPKAVLFDAYGTLFDVHSVVAAAEQLFPGLGEPLSQLWRQKQIEYTQLRTLAAPAGERYRPFWDVTIDALRFSAKKLGLTLTSAAEKRLMDEYACLSAFPDVLPALRRLREFDTRMGLAILSNGNPQMLDIAVKSAGMTGLFDHVLSVDAVRNFKPAAAAYALGTTAFGVPASELLFVSSNGWDACGATWYGYTTFWINRAGAPAEELGVTPCGSGYRMADMIAFIEQLGCAAAKSAGKGRARSAPGSDRP